MEGMTYKSQENMTTTMVSMVSMSIATDWQKFGKCWEKHSYELCSCIFYFFLSQIKILCSSAPGQYQKPYRGLRGSLATTILVFPICKVVYIEKH